MKKHFVPFFLVVVIGLFFVITLLKPFASTTNSVYEFSQYHYWVIIGTYVCVIFAVYLNRENLAIYNIDKLSLLIIILAGGIRVYLHTPNEVLYKNIVLILSVILLGITTLYWRKIPNTNMRWFLVGIFSCVIVIPLTIVEFTQMEKYSISNALYADHFSVYAIRNFLYNLTFVAPLEEIIFRGILWGEMRMRQFKEGTIFWSQGLLFLSMHFWAVFTPMTFFITLPVAIIVFSLLVKYSKQTSPSIISHILFNTLGPILVYIITNQR
jgi:membrane protease YdiL (CAAX protease family)